MVVRTIRTGWLFGRPDRMIGTRWFSPEVHSRFVGFGLVDCFGDSSFLGTALAMAGCLLLRGRCFAARVLGGCRSPRSLSFLGWHCVCETAGRGGPGPSGGWRGRSGVEARSVGRSVVVRVGRPWRHRTEWRLKRLCLVSRRDLWVGVWLCVPYIPPRRGRLLLWSRLLSVPGDCAHGPVWAECDRGLRCIRPR